MITIDDIKNMNAGAVLAEPIEVDILEVWERKSFNGQYPTTKQRVKLSFPGNQWMIAEFDGHPDQKPNEGKRVRIAPSQNKQGQPTSVTAVDSSFKGNTYRNLRITKAAKVYILGEEGSQGQSQQPGERPTQASTPPRTTTQYAGGATPRNISIEMNRLQNFYIRCLMGAQYIAKHAEQDLGVVLSPEQFQTTTASLYIQGTRDNLHRLEKHGPWGSNEAAEEPKAADVPSASAEAEDDIPF